MKTSPPSTLKGASLRRFRLRLLRWYAAEKRTLPWRDQRDPFRVWVSEVMLQQTRVAVVAERYKSFLRRFPNLHSLARARESAVLAEWSGLGYYRRARNLHKAARLLTGGGREVPRSSRDLQLLPGIGRYTAAAIASIAFGEPVAVLDGNVQRVLDRMFFATTKSAGSQQQNSSQHWALANELLDPACPGDFNQAMMELGATVCLPGKPNCAACPVREFCASKNRRRSVSRAPSARKLVTEYFGFWHARSRVYLVQRPAKAVRMPGMWEFPRIKRDGTRADFRLRHSITDTDYDVHAVRRTKGIPLAFSAGSWAPISRLSKIPLTGLTRKILKRALPGITL